VGLAKASAGDGDLEKGSDHRSISKSDNIRVTRKSPVETGSFLTLHYNKGLFWIITEHCHASGYEVMTAHNLRCTVEGVKMKTIALQELVQMAIKEKYGLQSRVGWNINNGVLSQVTVSFDAEEVRDKKVSELDTAAKDAVAASFKCTPRVLNVEITCRVKS
jgi:hypothetical protein